jgi:hypothetical protein
MPLVPPPSGPTAVAGSPAVRWSTAMQTSDRDRRLDSPDRLVAVDRPRESPASGGSGAAAARPREPGRQ